jgi:spore coat protein CotH
MKKSLLFFLIFYLLIVLIKPNEIDNEHNIDEKYTNDDENMIEEDIAQKFITEMGLDKPGKVTQAQYKDLLMKIFTKGEKVEENEGLFYKELIEKITSSSPEEFDSSELSKYIDQEKFISILDDLIKSKYGENVLNDFKNSSNLNKVNKDDL